jgi:hypothetical protein
MPLATPELVRFVASVELRPQHRPHDADRPVGVPRSWPHARRLATTGLLRCLRGPFALAGPRETRPGVEVGKDSGAGAGAG